MSAGSYSFVELERRSERPTQRVPAPQPTEQELLEKLKYTEDQIARLMQRRERILKQLNKETPK